MDLKITPIGVGRTQWLSDLLAERVEEMRHQFAELPAMATGIDALDRFLGPVRPGWSTLIASGPAVGRTTLAIQMAIHHASIGGLPMLLSSTLTSNDLALRILAIEADVGLSTLLDARLTERNWSRIGRVLAESRLEMVVANSVRSVRDLELFVSQVFNDRSVPSIIIVDDVDTLVNDPRAASGDAFDLLESMASALGAALVLTFRLDSVQPSSPARASRLLDDIPTRVARNIVMLEPDAPTAVASAHVIRTITGATGVVDLVRAPRSARFYGVADQERTPHPTHSSTASSDAFANPDRSEDDD